MVRFALLDLDLFSLRTEVNREGTVESTNNLSIVFVRAGYRDGAIQVYNTKTRRKTKKNISSIHYYQGKAQDADRMAPKSLI